MTFEVAPEIRQLLAPEQQIVFRGVDWATYRRLAHSDKRSVRFAYNGGLLEIISPSQLHAAYKNCIHDVVAMVARLARIPFVSLASTTWDRPETGRGIEADQSYLFAPEKLAIARPRVGEVAQRLAPDLAVEIDLRRSVVDRPAIYATLGVPEVWRFNGLRLDIDRLRPDGAYEVVGASQFLPIAPEEVVHWVQDDKLDDLAWSDRLEAWVRNEILPRRRG
jgi:Uma2 family endonuclease